MSWTFGRVPISWPSQSTRANTNQQSSNYIAPKTRRHQMFPYFSKNSEHDHNFIQTASKSSKKHHECMRATEWSEPSLWPSPDRRQISSLPRYGKTLMEPYMPLFPGAIGALRESEPVSVLEKMDAMEIVFFPTSPEVYCIGSNCYIFFKIHKFWKNRTTQSPKVQQ